MYVAPVTTLGVGPHGASMPRAALQVSFQQEVQFYTTLADKVSPVVKLPRCVHVAPTVIVLMDESNPTRHVGNQLKGCSRAQASLIISSLAALHARFWKSEELDLEYVTQGEGCDAFLGFALRCVAYRLKSTALPQPSSASFNSLDVCGKGGMATHSSRFGICRRKRCLLVEAFRGRSCTNRAE